MKKKSVVIIIVIILSALIVFGIYCFLEKPIETERNSSEKQIARSSCLEDNEIVVFQLRGIKTRATSADIVISNKITSKEEFRFQIGGLIPYHGHPYEFHKCGVYVIRRFNYDVKTRQGTPNFRKELWKYDYRGKGEKILIFSETDDKGNFKLYFGDDFRVDPTELYVALIKGYPDQQKNYGFSIRNNKISKDVFLLSHSSILEINPNFVGSLGLKDWTKAGNYFWGDIFAGAPRLGFVRIQRDTWKYDILPVPAGTLGGTAFNPEYGCVTYDTGPGWIGIDVVAEQVYDEWRKAGKKVDFYLYNLFTKEKTLLATTGDSSWNFKPKWLSDTELQYELPTGEKKIYKIQ